MMNKGKKRVISDLDDPEKSTNTIGPGSKSGIKKSKVNVDITKTDFSSKGIPSIKPSLIGTNVSDRVKKLKKKKVKNSKSSFNVSDASPSKQDVEPKEHEVLDKKTKPKITMKQLKAKQLKNEKRKQLRREHGQYKVEGSMLSEEMMRRKIDEIQSRENMTKTAKRKLRILKKKLSIAEGNAPPSPTQSKIQAGEQKSPKLTKSQKKHLKQEKMKSEIVPQSLEGIKKESRNKKVEVGKSEEISNLSKVSNLKQSQKEKELKKTPPKTKMTIPIKKESSEENDDSESLEDQSEDESGQTSQFKMEVDDASDVQEDDEEDEVDDEEEESNDESVEKNEENVVKASLPQKKQKVPKKEKNLIATNVPNQQNGDKKQRYVLFVGNLPFKATVDDVKQHFLQKVSQVVSVRIPTAKGTKKPRGFGYVEVQNNVDYEKALSLHQSNLQGFKLNVEYTQTGSKNIKNKQEIVAKNKKLHAIRKAGKLSGSKKENGNRSFRRNLKKKQQAQQE